MGVSPGEAEQPLFVVGMPRSGTTIIFEILARHPDLAWVSNYCRMYPKWPWVNLVRRFLDNRVIRLHAGKRQYGRRQLLNYYRPQPDEAYEFWDEFSGKNFARQSLHGEVCRQPYCWRLADAVRRVRRWQGRSRVAAKLTGPPRIGFLRSVFPHARFLHVVRDGRAVVQSLLNVPFWKNKGGYDGPFWEECLAQEDLGAWEDAEWDPGILAAAQWRAVLRLAEQEGGALRPAAFRTIRYEDFVAKPHEALSSICDWAGLWVAPELRRYVDEQPIVTDLNAKYKRDFSADYTARLEAVMDPMLAHHGYM